MIEFTKKETAVLLKALSFYNNNILYYTYDNELSAIVWNILKKVAESQEETE